MAPGFGSYNGLYEPCLFSKWASPVLSLSARRGPLLRDICHMHAQHTTLAVLLHTVLVQLPVLAVYIEMKHGACTFWPTRRHSLPGTKLGPLRCATRLVCQGLSQAWFESRTTLAHTCVTACLTIFYTYTPSVSVDLVITSTALRVSPMPQLMSSLHDQTNKYRHVCHFGRRRVLTERFVIIGLLYNPMQQPGLHQEGKVFKVGS